jgi:YesN/AraC family two-component response regulator
VDISVPYERMALELSTDLLPKWIDYDFFAAFRNARAFANIIPSEYTKKFGLDEQFRHIAQVASQKQNHQDAAMLLAIIPLLTKLADCSEELLSSSHAPRFSLQTSADKFVHACVQYINENAMDPLTVHDLANHFHLSTSHIQHTFKKQTGII